MGQQVLRDGLRIKGTLAPGAGDPLLTRDSITNDVGEIVSGITLLPENYIFVGNASSIPVAVAVSGDISNTAGNFQIASGVILNSDINAAAGILFTKLAATTANRAIISDASGFLSPSAVTNVEISYLSGVSSGLQIQLDNKQATITGAASTVTTVNLPTNRAVISNGSGKIDVSATTSTEVGYLSGVSSSVQTQLNNKLSVSLVSPTDGDMLYQSSGVYTNIPAGTNGQVLTIVSGLPSWQNGTSNGLPSGGTTNQYLRKNSNTNYDTVWDTFTLSKVTDVTASFADLNILTGVSATITSTEIGYLDGVASNIQTQIDNKLDNALAYNALFVGSGSNLPSQLSPGSPGDILTIIGGSPQWQAPTPPGNVSGVSPTIVNTIARWNDVLGTSIKGSNVTIDNSDNITGVVSLTTINQGALVLRELTASGTNSVSLRAAGTMGADYTITFPAATPGANTFLKYNGADYEWGSGGGGATEFVDLTDVPATYVGQANKLVSVKNDETGLEFITFPSGTVTSVSGTSNRITSTGGTNPVIDIAATYVGQSSITTLGTIGTGTWQGTLIGTSYGGTGLSAIGTATQLIRVNAGATALEYFTPTYISGNQTITLSGDVSGSGTTAITTTIGTNVVTDGKLRQSSGLSIIGRSTNTTGNVADIVAASDFQVLRRSGTSVSFGSINLASSAAVTGILPIVNGGTGSSTQNWWGLSGTSTLAGVATITSSAASQHIFNGTYTTTANNQQHMLFGGTITTRATASDTFYAYQIFPTITAGAATQSLAALYVDASGIATTNSPTKYALRARGGAFIFTDANATAAPTLVVDTTATQTVFDVRSSGSSLVSVSTNGFSSVLTIAGAGSNAIGFTGSLVTSAGISAIQSINCNTTAGANNDVLRGIRLFNTWTIGVRTGIKTYAFHYNPTIPAFTGSHTGNYGFVMDGTLSSTVIRNGINVGPDPTSQLHLGSGTATANTAPLKLTSGTALTTPEDGAIEYHTSHLYFTIGSTRYQLDQQSGGSTTLTSTQIAYGSGTNTVTSEAAFSYNATDNKMTVDRVNYNAQASAPAGSVVNGDLYYDSTLLDFRGRINGQWSGITRPGSSSIDDTDSPYTLIDSERNFITLVDTTTGDVTIDLSTLSLSTNWSQTFINTGTGNLILSQGSNTLNAIDTTCSTQYGWVTVSYSGSGVYYAAGALGTGGSGVSDGDYGDITVTSSGSTWSIDNNAVTLVKIQDIATASFVGRVTASTGDPEVLTGTQATTLLDTFTSSLKGLTPASGGGTTNFLRADGTWAAPSGGISDGDKGDITVTGSGATWTIDSSVITYAKMQNAAGGTRIIGRASASSGVHAEIVATADGQVLRRSGGTLGFGSLDLTDADTVGSSILPVANGGTGLATITANRVLYGNGTSAFGNEAEFTYDPSTNTLHVGTLANIGGGTTGLNVGMISSVATIQPYGSIPNGRHLQLFGEDGKVTDGVGGSVFLKGGSGIGTGTPGGVVLFSTNTNLSDGGDVLKIGNTATSPSVWIADSVAVYARDVSSSSELFVMDESGFETQLS